MFELKKVEKAFPGVRALKGIDFRISKGEIVGLVGENGAGKSTLMKIMYGQYPHDGGEVLVNGKAVRFENPRQAAELGIGMVFQEQSLIGNLSVMENIFLGHERQFTRAGVVRWGAMAAAARKQLAKVKLDIDPKARTETLSFAQRQLVELAKVLTLEERVHGDLVILLDEPTSVLSATEVELLFSLVRDLRTRASFVFVSHRLDEVLEISDRIYVLKDGEVVDVVKASEAVVESIQHRMVGRDINHQYYREDKQRPFDAARILIEARGLGLPGHYEEISFQLHAGEVLAIVGTDGSGREEVMRTIFGLERPRKGELLIEGDPVTEYSPAAGVARRIAYVPRERKIEGIIAGLNVFENLTLCQLGRYSRFGFLRVAEERGLGVSWIRKLAIKAPSELADCGNLSGGNQQKVVLAKWRSAGSRLILLDHPTRGLDIGAKEDVYDMVREMCADGCGLLLIADTLEEAIGLAHNIIVIKDGRVQKTFDCVSDGKPTLYDLVHYMV
jgi:ribose transport system ATP-binding protein